MGDSFCNFILPSLDYKAILKVKELAHEEANSSLLEVTFLEKGDKVQIAEWQPLKLLLFT